MTHLIGITGCARAGKDSFGAVLAKHGFKRTAFANALKSAVAYIANEDTNLYFDDDAKEEYTDALETTRRMALQKVGSAIRNSLGPETWVRRVIRAWEAQGKPATVVTDVRYANEALAIRANGGLIVRVVRPGSGLSGEAGQHESEAGLPDELVDIEVVNDGTLAELNQEALKIVRLCSMGTYDV